MFVIDRAMLHLFTINCRPQQQIRKRASKCQGRSSVFSVPEFNKLLVKLHSLRLEGNAKIESSVPVKVFVAHFTPKSRLDAIIHPEYSVTRVKFPGPCFLVL